MGHLLEITNSDLTVHLCISVCINLKPPFFTKSILLIDNKTAFFVAVEKGNVEMVKTLLTNDDIDVNIGQIFIIFYQHSS